jgi:hypothetical protein
MAYLRDLPRPLCRCSARATVELLNRANATVGYYCRRCGRSRLAELQAAEAAERAPEAIRRMTGPERGR